MSQTLNDIMEFDHVIRVNEDGSIEENVEGMYGPEGVEIGSADQWQILDEHEKEFVEEVKRHGWELLSGWSAQWRYGGPIMHPSEFIGGGIEEHIRETPGLYCVFMVEMASKDGEEEPEPAGWAIAYRES